MIPEGRSIFPNLTVTENLLMYTYRRSGLEGSPLEERAIDRFPVLGGRRSSWPARCPAASSGCSPWPGP